MHLAAARLLRRELDLVAEPPKQPDDGLPDLGEQQVVVAGDEQRDAHRQRPRPATDPRGSNRRMSCVARTSAQRLEIARQRAAGASRG